MVNAVLSKPIAVYTGLVNFKLIQYSASNSCFFVPSSFQYSASTVKLKSSTVSEVSVTQKSGNSEGLFAEIRPQITSELSPL